MRFLKMMLIFVLCLSAAAAVSAQETDVLTLLAEDVQMPALQLMWNEDGTAVTVISKDEVRQITLADPADPDVLVTDQSGAAFVAGSTVSKAAVLSESGKDVYLYGEGQNNPLDIKLDVTPLAVLLSDDGKSLIVNDRDEIRGLVYDAKSGDLDKELSGFTTAAPVYDMRLSRDGKYAVWHSRGTFQVQNTADKSFGEHISLWDFAYAYDLSPDNKSLAVGMINEDYTNGIVMFFDPQSGKETARTTLGEKAPYELSYSADGSLLAAADSDTIYLVNPKTAGLLTSYTLTNTDKDDIRVSRVSASPDGKLIAVLMSDGELILIQ